MSAAELRPANVERPKVVYNSATQKFVMWAHWENGRDYGEARAMVASSDTVDGDYTYHGSFRPLADSGVMDHGKPGYMSRDCTLFVDDDGRGYFLSAADENYDLNLYLLTPDYLGVEELAATLFPQGHREAPALFKRNSTYFLVTSGATGWDPNQAQFATSTSLTGVWSSLQNVGDGTTYHSQSTYVVPVTGSMGTEYLYLGDRWAGAYDGRVNDSQYVWLPITFPSATTMTMSYVSSLQIDASLGLVRGQNVPFRLKNKKSGLFLDTEGGAVENGARVVQAEMSDLSAQGWTFSYNGSGHMELHTDSGDKVLDVPDESTDSGALLALWDDVNGPHQGWRIVDLGGGEYQLRNQNSGHYLSVAQGSTESGAPVEQSAASNGDEQIWRISTSP
jgi:Ricin-type beta-trefoil lectin domain-like/Glycosyl hydrolases family 43